MEEEKDNESLHCIDYLHPEILSTEVLVALFNERKIKFNNKEPLDKCKLIEIFYNNLLPKCQRVYGEGRRAKRLMKTRKDKEMVGLSKNSSNERSCSSKKVNLSFQNQTQEERIKPPPSNNKSKTITLSSIDSNSAINTDKRKIADSLKPNDQSTKKRRHSPIIW